MSAMNVMVKSSSVHLVTDGAGYDADGRLLLIAPKAAALPHLHAAIGVRGPAGAVPLFSAWLSAVAQTFDGLIESAPKTLRELKPVLNASFRHCVFGFDFDVVICGISEIGGPAAYVISSVDRPDVPAWEAVQLRGLSLAPAELEMQERIFASPSYIEDLSPEIDGCKILELQRG